VQKYPHTSTTNRSRQDRQPSEDGARAAV
jgi:hypothetical protein